MTVQRRAANPLKISGRMRLPDTERRVWEKTYAKTDYRKLPWYSAQPSPWLVHAVENGWIDPGGIVLDVGCGAGSNVLWLGKQGFHAYGVDIAPAAIAAAERRAKAAHLDVSFRVADAVGLPFPRQTFSAVVDSGCFHTLPIVLRPTYADEIARVLRPEGTFLLAWIGREETGWQGPPHRPSLSEIASVFESQFVFVSTQFHTPRAGPRRWYSGGSLAGYTACLVRRRGRQPPPR